MATALGKADGVVILVVPSETHSVTGWSSTYVPNSPKRLAIASHALLDAMTKNSRGMPLFWPLSFRRFEMPWRPIRNPPTGIAFLSRQGLEVALIELGQFAPLLLFALRPFLPSGRGVGARPRQLKVAPAPSMVRDGASAL